MDLVLNNLQRLICHKTQTTNNQLQHTDTLKDLLHTQYISTTTTFKALTFLSFKIEIYVNIYALPNIILCYKKSLCNF